MHRKGPAALLGLALLIGPSPAGRASDIDPAPLLLDRVVAVVGERIVLSSDLALERALATRDPRPFPLGGDPDRGTLEVAVDATVIRGLAGDVAIYQPSAALVRERLATVRATWEDPGEYIRFLSAFGLDEDSLASVLYARLVVERYLQRAVILPSQTAGEDEAALRARYAAWIGEARQQVSIRMVRVWSGEAEAFPLTPSAPAAASPETP